MHDPEDAELLRSAEAALIIIHVERLHRIEPNQPLTGRPILRPHFQVTHFECVDDPIYISIEAGLGGFDLHAGLVGVGQHNNPFSSRSQFAEKGLGTRQKSDQVGQFFVHRDNIDANTLRPIVQIRPGQLAFNRPVHGHETLARGLEGEAVHGRIAAREFLFKEEIVEMPIEQCPVHIKQDVVDLVPIQRGLSCMARGICHEAEYTGRLKGRRDELSLRKILCYGLCHRVHV